MKTLFLIFLIVPLAEVYFLIQVGHVIGAMPTIALVVGTAFLGAVLVRSQGFATIARVRAQLDREQLPAMEIFEGLFLLLAGALLLTPGFFTDAIGFCCLTPPLRQTLIRKVLSNLQLIRRRTAPRRENATSGRILEGEYRDLDR